VFSDRDEVILSLYARVEAMCSRMSRRFPGVDAEDLRQAALTAALEAYPRAIGDPVPFLITAARRAAWRYAQREMRHLGHMAVDDELEDEREALHDAGEQMLRDALTRLSPVDRELVRSYMDGASQRELAEALGVSQPAIHKRLHNNFALIRAYLQNFGYNFGPSM
jgi:RNA polymerase sigma factor (sigma-70 family)